MDKFSLGEQGFKLLTKIIIPSFIVAIIGVSVAAKRGKATFWNSFLSIIISIGGAYIFSDWILATFYDKYIVLVVSFIAIITDKFLEWVLYKFKVDELMQQIINIGFNFLKSKSNIK